MSIQNINTIQNPNTFTYISNLSEKYMYESLANLGQRFGIKGDGIETNKFTIGDLFGNIADDNIISKMHISNNKLFISLYNKDNLITPINNSSLEIKYSLNNAVITNSPIKLNIPINGIDYYRENALMYQIDNFLYICTLGCSIVDENNTGDSIIEFNIEKYNIETNELIESLKLIDTNETDETIKFQNSNNTNSTPKYYLYYISKISDNNDYAVRECYINVEDIETVYNSFSDFCVFEYNDIILTHYNSYKEINILNIFNEFRNIGFIDANDTEYHVHLTDTEFEPTDNLTYSIQLLTILHYVFNQIKQMYLFFYEIYNNDKYYLDNIQLKKTILFNIFNKAYTLTEDVNNNINNFQLFIPVNYQFDYYNNDNNKYFIYSNQTPISIYFTNENLISTYREEYNNLNILLANTTGEEQIILFKYTINYNTINKKIINSIDVSELYSTPYIKNGYWVINGTQTKFKAVGKDAGNPNIMMLYVGGTVDSSNNLKSKRNNEIIDNNSSNSIKVLSTINDTIFNSNFKYRKHICKVKLFDNKLTEIINNKISSNNVSADEYGVKEIYELHTVLPYYDNDNDEFLEKLKDCFIIVLTDLSNLDYNKDIFNDPNNKYQDNLLKSLYGKSFITTMWRYDNISQDFVPVISPLDDTNNITLTFSELSNVNNSILTLSEYIINDIIDKTSFLKTYRVPYISFPGINLKNNIYTYMTNTYSYISNSLESNTLLTYYNREYTHKVNPLVLTPNSTMSKVNKIQKIALKGTYDAYEKDCYEGITNGNVLTNNLEHCLLENVNINNRVNILLYDNNDNNNTNGTIYYTYIGSSLSDKKKHIVHFGTYNILYNIDKDIFNTNIEVAKNIGVSIDFDNIILNSNIIDVNTKNLTISKKVDSVPTYVNSNIYFDIYLNTTDNYTVNLDNFLSNEINNDTYTFEINGNKILLTHEDDSLIYTNNIYYTYVVGSIDTTYYGIIEANNLIGQLTGYTLNNNCEVNYNSYVTHFNTTYNNINRTYMYFVLPLTKYNISNNAYANISVEYSINNLKNINKLYISIKK